MDKAELEALLMQARAGERMAKSLEDLATDVAEMKPSVDALRKWHDNQARIEQEANARGPLVWVFDIFDNPKFRVVVTAFLAALATALTNWMMSQYGGVQTPPAPSSISAPADKGEG